jgi:opacity protein-like surface antigen
MFKFRQTVIVGLALLAGSVAGAEAADLHRGGSIKDAPYMPAIMQSPATWYVRLDTGHVRFDAPAMVEDGIYDLTATEIESRWSLGGGVGMYFSKSTRGDITYTHLFEKDAQGTLIDPLATLPGVRRFGLTSDVVLANLYYDFDLRSRFTPYIGVGLGVVRHSTKEGTVTDGCGCTGTIDAADKWSVAGALMAGFSVALRERFHLDAGYRFLYLGDATTGPVRATITATGATVVSNDPTVEGINAHEFRVGLRYDIR